MDKFGHVIHVLIVEDDEMQLELIKDAFSSYQNQYDIQAASSLKETYTILSQDTPHIILTDNKLPDGEGKELIKVAKGKFPLILMTAHGSEEFAVQAMKEGAQDYIVKTPDLFRHLPETVKHALIQWRLKTEKEQSEKALLESEQKFRNLFNNINDAVFLHRICADKMHQSFIEVNEEACEILGYTKEELLALSFFDIGRSEQTYNNGDIEDKVLSEGSACFEMILLTKNGNHIPVEINAHIIEHNQAPAVLSVARDITEQKQYQQYIEHLNSLLLAIRNVNQLIIQETDIYRMVEKAAGMLVETLAYSGCVIALMNEEIKKIVPVSHIGNAILNKSFAISSDGKGRAPKCIKNVVISKKIQVIHNLKMCTNCSYSGCNKEHGVISIVVPMLRDNNIIGFIIVTRQHKTFLTNKEEQLLIEVADDLVFAREKIIADTAHRESENKYRTLFMAEPDPIFLIDENSGRLLDANPAAEELYGYAHAELLTMKACDLSCEPDITQKAIKIKNDNIAHIPHRIHKKKNGDKIIVEISARHFERNGRMINISSIRDITERKRVEEERILTQHTINNTDLSIFWISPRGKFLYVNEGACRNLEYTKDELLNMYIWDIDHNYPQKTRKNQWQQHKNEKVKTFESWHKPKKGKAYPVEITSCYLEFKGREYEFAYASNIIERKQAENHLKESEEKFRVLAENSADVIYKMDVEQLKYTYISPSVKKIFGYTPDEAYKLKPNDVLTPESLQRQFEVMNNDIQKGIMNKTLRLDAIHKKGHVFPIEVNASFLLNEHNKPKEILGVIRNITERIKDEETLRVSEQKLQHLNLVLKALLNINEIILHEKEKHLLIQKVCYELTRTRGYKSAFIALTHAERIIYYDMAENMEENFEEIKDAFKKGANFRCINDALSTSRVIVIEQPQKYCTKCFLSYINPEDKAIAIRIKHRKTIYGAISVSVPKEIAVTEAEKKLFKRLADNLAFALYNIDMENEREKARHEIKINEEKFRNFFDNTNEAIIITDFDGRFIQVNNALVKMLGYTEKEIYDMNIMDIIVPEYAMKLQEKISIVKENYETPVLEIEVLKKDTSQITIEISSKIINYIENEKVILSIVRDVSLRKQLEQKVLDSMLEAEDSERKRIAEDLHDEMGPHLSTIKLYVNEIKKVDNLEQKEKIFNNLNKILDQSVMKIKSISNNLMPNVLIDYGVVKAIESFVSNVIINPNINIHIETIDLHGRYHDKFEINMYRIVIELINNTLKHAKANEINIIFEENNNRFYLTYKDNGKGFEFDKKLYSKKGLGLQNILNRMYSMNGTRSVVSTPGKGMVFSMEINDINMYYER